MSEAEEAASPKASGPSSAASSVASAPPAVSPRAVASPLPGVPGLKTPTPPPPPSSGPVTPRKVPLPEDSRTIGGGGLHSAGGGRRPVKVWNSGRTVRKALVVSTYEEFQRKGREKLGLSSEEPVSIVLEGDGTQVDDGEYFQTLPENSIYMFLRSGESWHPTGSDSIKAAVMEIIPSIVCDTLYSLGLHDKIPSWKVMDNKGRVTVVLHWDPEEVAALRGTALPAIAGPTRQSSTCSTIASGGPRLLGIRSISQRSGSSVSSTPCLSRDNSRASGGAAIQQHSMLVQTSFDSHRDSSKAQLGPHITVINHDVDKGSLLGPPLGASRGSSGGSSMVMGIPSPRQLSRQGSSVESTAIVPLHHASVQQATTFSKQGGSPTSTECDFHCSNFCAASASTSHKSSTSAGAAASGERGPSSATSPLQPSMEAAATSASASTTTQQQQEAGKRSLPKGAHVRFSHVEVDRAAQDNGHSTATTTTANNQTASNGNGSITCRAIVETTTMTAKVTTTASAEAAEADPMHEESSESETDNNDETGTADKFLLLIDQLSLEQPSHLSIKDIGIILDRLSSKIIDVGMLERQVEASDTHNWTIKATIRGQAMRELGVIYNSNYYAISEHPSFNFSKRLTDGRVDIGPLEDDPDDDDMDDFEEVNHVNLPPVVPSKIHTAQ